MKICIKRSMKLFDQIVSEAIDISQVQNLQEVNLINFMQLA